MIQFDYSNEKYSIPAGAPENAMDEARRFMSELRSRLGDDTVVLAVSLETGKRFAGLAVCSRETKEFVPDNRLIIRDHSSSLYEHDPDKGTITLTTYDSGDKNVREHKEGVLADFFLKKSNHPCDIFYNLLLEEGFEPESLMLQTHYWTDLRELGAVEKDDEGCEEEDPEGFAWALTDDFDLPWPFDQRITVYECKDLRLYTRTDKDDNRGRLGICEVYTSLEEFLGGPAPDLEFPDTPENRDLLLEALGKASAVLLKTITDTPWATLLAVLRDSLADIVCQEE